VDATQAEITTPTSHVDLIPTLLGLTGVDVEAAAAHVARHHTEAHPLPGRDLSRLVGGRASPVSVSTPIYFLTEDQISRGLRQANILSGKSFEPLSPPSCIESVIAPLPTGEGGAEELWKLNHYYERLDEWHADHGVAPNPFAAPAAEPVWELHNLTLDPEERHNRSADAADALSRLQSLLDAEREEKRLLPSLVNPAP
jgi:arylsulfatase A-like enzyme